MTLSRRSLVKSAGLGALTFIAGGRAVLLTPRQARAENVPLAVLGGEEAQTLEALGEILASGAAEAGIAHYVDNQLAAAANDCLLMIRYLDVPPPWDGFYRAGLAALEALSEARHGARFAALRETDAVALVREISAARPGEWPADAPPAPFFYFVLRGDAVDVAYGTVEGFARLGVPYLAHIMPETRW